MVQAMYMGRRRIRRTRSETAEPQMRLQHAMETLIFCTAVLSVMPIILRRSPR